MQAGRSATIWSAVEVGIAALSTVSAVMIFCWCGNLSFEYAREYYFPCGTPRDHIHGVLLYEALPLALLVLKASWIPTRRAGVARSIARCAGLTAVLACGVVLAGMHWF